MEPEPKYFPCPMCAGILYDMGDEEKPILCCENCNCINYNVTAMTDTHPESERNVHIHALGALSVAARNLMNALLTEGDAATVKDLRSQLEMACKAATTN